MADHIIETNFAKEFVDRANRRIKRMWTRFGLKSQDSDVEKIDEDEDSPGPDGLSC